MLLLGRGVESVVSAVADALEPGTSLGAHSEARDGSAAPGDAEVERMLKGADEVFGAEEVVRG